MPKAKLTDDEIDAMLRRVVTETGEITKNVLAGAEVRTLALAVAMLATIIGQEREARATEALAEEWDHLFEEFNRVREECSQPVVSLERFIAMLTRHRDEIRARKGCKDVTFTVYVKDGKAALRATPKREK